VESIICMLQIVHSRRAAETDFPNFHWGAAPENLTLNR
jgi:hypothetical protein